MSRQILSVSLAIALAAFMGFGTSVLAGPDQAEDPGPRPPASLRCEYLVNPMGVDVQHPRFSWSLNHSERGQRQSAFQLLVSRRPEVATGDEWDSGKVDSEESTQIGYQGKALSSGQTYHWKVRYWDGNGTTSSYSQVAHFDTGLFSSDDWKASWIVGKNQLRKEFSLSARVRRARAYVSGLGYYELYLNGTKVGDHVLDPGWTTYDKRVLYTTYDITSLLQSGPNAVGVMLGQGWYGSKPQEPRATAPRGLILQMSIEQEDGRLIRVVSDSSWKGQNGPILSDSIYDGEVYDARKETPGWNRPGFSKNQWSPVENVKGPGGVMSSQMMPPIKVVDTLMPLKMTNPQAGVYVFDLGQNISGWVQLRVRGPRGTAVRLRHAELLYEDGMLNTENLRGARAQDTYILKGDGDEQYEPRFTYHGFRYVELTGFPGVPTLDTLRGKVVHTAVGSVGSFACSKPILNQLQRIVVWGQKTNLHSIPTDCPQRDERMGWMADAQITAEEAILNFDMAAFYTNFIRNIRDVQDASGKITDTVPFIWGSRPADPAWGTAYPLLCWYMYQNYGDKRILEENYEGLKKYVEFLRGASEEGILKYFYYADWVATDETPGSLVSSFYYCYDVDILARVAKILAKDGEAADFRRLAEQIKEAFHQHFYHSETKNYVGGQQTANLLALYLNLVPESVRGPVVGNLIHNIIYAHDTHLTTGLVGTKYVMELLPRVGRADLAYDLVTQRIYPSWGYMIDSGATTVWELWQNKTGPSMNSHNHPMFGSVGAYLYKALAGINLDEELIGYKKIRIQPQAVRDLIYASGSIETLRGTVVSAWLRSQTNKTFRLEVTIPVNSQAEIHLPKFTWSNILVKEGGHPVWQNARYQPGVAGLTGASEVGGEIVIQAGSGRYVLELAGE
jgi:alpha-L-rhamnosidase